MTYQRHSSAEAGFVELAMSMATVAHRLQVDKSGRPYVGHLERVADLVQRSGGTWVQEAAAWLHDSIEDTDMTADELRRSLPEEVVQLVETLTHRKGEPNEVYWGRVAADPKAARIKLCDIYDNLSPERMFLLDLPTQRRLWMKYANAIHVLANA